jgi:DeoR/GlpR family transcriptional regulator of sugar metabolism
MRSLQNLSYSFSDLRWTLDRLTVLWYNVSGFALSLSLTMKPQPISISSLQTGLAGMSRVLFPQERRDEIIALIAEDGRASVADLSRRFDVSEVTIRSDLEILAQQGLLIRTRGGAVAAQDSEIELDFHVRLRLHTDEKERIGKAAAELVHDGESIVLDASTTALAMLDYLRSRRQLTVITNGVFTVTALLDAPGITVLMPGGFLYRDSASLVGQGNGAFLNRFHFVKGFFGAKGFTLNEGLTDLSNAEITLKRELIASAKQVIALVDSSKWGRLGFASFASVDQIDCVITDHGAPHDMVASLEEAGVRVILV